MLSCANKTLKRFDNLQKQTLSLPDVLERLVFQGWIINCTFDFLTSSAPSVCRAEWIVLNHVQYVNICDLGHFLFCPGVSQGVIPINPQCDVDEVCDSQCWVKLCKVFEGNHSRIQITHFSFYCKYSFSQHLYST